MKTRYYILSTGRTATTFLYQFFKENYPEISITHQTRWSRLFNLTSNLPISTKIKVRLISFLFKTLKKDKIPLSTVDPLLSMSIALLINANKVNDNVKIIHIVRNPKTFVTSFLNWKKSSAKKFFLHHIVPYWQPHPGIKERLEKRKFLYNKFEQFCWVWNKKNSYFYNSFRNNPNYKLIKLEDITDKINSVQALNDLTAFLNLPQKMYAGVITTEKKINSTKVKSFPSWKDWPLPLKEYLLKNCGNLMKELGYSVDYK